MSRKPGQRIQSLDRGLKIIEYIAGQDRPVRLAALAELLGVEKSSASRLVSTLFDRGYVRQDPETSGVVLDEKVFELAGKLAGRRRVQDAARTYLHRLARGTGETAHLAVRGVEGVVLVDHEFGDHPLAVTTQWGHSEPFHCTALGKALLAGATETELTRLLGPGPLESYTDKTVTGIAALAEQCRAVDAEQLAVDDEEFRVGVRCLACPVRDFRGRVVAAIGISGPVERLGDEDMDRFAGIVKQSARDLSSQLGYAKGREEIDTDGQNGLRPVGA